MIKTPCWAFADTCSASAVSGKVFGITDTLRIFQPGGYDGTSGGMWLDVLNADTIVTITGIESNQNEVPSKFNLSQNYPNPFNPSTTISYNLAKSGNVRIKVFNISGKEIEELVNKKLEAGIHKITFNASKYSSGIYFYSMIIDGNVVNTKKMMYVK